METYERSTALPHSLERVFAWHETAASFDRFLPPLPRMELLERTGTIRDGDRATLRVGVGPFGFRFTVEHEGYQPLKEFGDRHIGGPYRSLRHRHVFRSTGEASCELTDRIHCEPRLMSAMLGRAWLQRTMERTLEFCQKRVRRDLDRHAAGPTEPLRVLVSGASGLIGGALTAFLESGGHAVVRLVRRPPASAGEIAWDPDRRADRRGCAGRVRRGDPPGGGEHRRRPLDRGAQAPHPGEPRRVDRAALRRARRAAPATRGAGVCVGRRLLRRSGRHGRRVRAGRRRIPGRGDVRLGAGRRTGAGRGHPRRARSSGTGAQPQRGDAEAAAAGVPRGRRRRGRQRQAADQLDRAG